MTGKTIKSLLENGIDTKRKSIIVSEGPMPLIENISYEDIERFRNQVKIVDMIKITDLEIIQSKIKSLIKNNPKKTE
jgi:tetrahydromethanopterin S-methyltransferase subunit A